MLKRLHNVSFFLPLLIFIVLILFLWQGLHGHPHQVPSPLINAPIPQFQMPSLNSRDTVITNKIFKGHVSLFNVFATWCMSCQLEHPVLMDIANSHRVMIVGLNYKDSRPLSKRWLHHYGNPYKKIIFDAQGQLGINLGVYGTPETYIVDKHGIVRYKYIGPVSQKIWHTVLLPQINKLKKEN